MKKRRDKKQLLNALDANKLNYKITQLFNEYKIFIKNPDLKLPKIESFNRSEENDMGATTSEVILPDSPNQTLRFRTEQFNIQMCGVGVKAHYFHEFTHISNYYKFISIFEFDEFASYTKLYDEFHATEIQMKAACGFENINDNKKISLKDKIEIKRDIITLEDYFKKIISEYHREIPIWINEYNKNKTSPIILLDRLMTHSMYYYSKINFLFIYCSDNYEEIIDNTLFINELGSELKKIIELLQSNDIDKTILIESAKIDDIIKDNFLNKYYYKYDI